MGFSNALPRGEVQGDVAIVQTRRLTLDGHGTVEVATVHHTRHSLIAHARLFMELAQALEDKETADVTDLRKHG